jgi:RNA polymerase sigma factor (sigma-70 family)
MSWSPATAGRSTHKYTAELREALPHEVSRLLEASTETEADEAWAEFVAAYSATLIRVATAFAPGYDGALDRYAYMLDELRRHECRRLRRFAADGRGQFSTWLAVVARRLCLDHYRRKYGRFRSLPSGDATTAASRAARRRLVDLSSALDDLAQLADSGRADPWDELEAGERRSALARAVGVLPPGDQLLLRLRFEDDLSAREIAALLGLPTPFHVYRRLQALCTALRALMERRGAAQSA